MFRIVEMYSSVYNGATVQNQKWNVWWIEIQLMYDFFSRVLNGVIHTNNFFIVVFV